METEEAAPAGVGLSLVGQTYVAMVAAMAVISVVSGSHGWYVALVVLCLPLSLLALWVGFYAGLAAGFLVGHDPSELSWAVGLVWVLVWTTTAWINARIAEKVVRRGWEALRVAPRTTEPVDPLDPYDD